MGRSFYNHPLKKAQEEGYFKPIKFEKIYEYNTKNKDRALAEKGIEQLRLDKQNYAHILLARVGTKKRADEVFEIYNEYSPEFRVVKIHSVWVLENRKKFKEKLSDWKLT